MEVLIKLAGETEFARMEPEVQVEIQQLKARVKIQQLKELKVFNALKLSIEVLIKLTGETELAQIGLI